jgi:DNA-binding MarR family transcriptional regulator
LGKDLNRIYLVVDVVKMELLERFPMQAIRGRTYSLHVLDVLMKSEESTFTEIIDEVGISPTTLSLTLKDLVEEGFAEKRVYGRNRYYSITEKGEKALRLRPRGPQFDVDRMTQLVAKRLREKGVLDEYPEVSNEQLMQAIRRRVKRFIDQVAEDLEINFKGGK